jgi:hypothetical protein
MGATSSIEAPQYLAGINSKVVITSKPILVNRSDSNIDIIQTRAYEEGRLTDNF